MGEDSWKSNLSSVIESSEQYNNLKNKMLKSVYQNGGFYVGRYETGIADTQPNEIDTNPEARTAEGETTQEPVIQANAYPYTFVNVAQAQGLATRFAENLDGYESNLLFGVQWDLILKHIETKAVNGLSGNEYNNKLNEIQAQLKEDSTSWGNYLDTKINITNPNLKYFYKQFGPDMPPWTENTYLSKQDENYLSYLSTGATEEFKKQNIYDLAGNVSEMTLESSSAGQISRGGNASQKGNAIIDNSSGGVTARAMTIFSSNMGVGFRVALYKDPDEDTGSGTISGGATEGSKPSDLYAEGKLQIGDFVNYDAGKWTQEEINAIQVGPTSALVTANGSTQVPNQQFQFGGFEAGSSRNENVCVSDVRYNYIKDETGNAVTGWRVFDIDGDTITLISAGNPESYYDYYNANISEYILFGNGNDGVDTSLYHKRDWSDYVNLDQGGYSATVLTKTMLNTWYSKYIQANANIETTSIFQKIYSSPYLSYQNIVDNGSRLYLAEEYGYPENYLSGIARSNIRSIGGMYGDAGLRVLVTLKSDVLLSSEKVGTKTLSGGNMDTYGGPQTYNVWDIANTTYEPNTDGEIVDVVDPHWEVKNVNEDIENQKVTMDLIVTDKYFNESTLTSANVAEKIKIYQDGAIINADGTVTGTELTHIIRELSEETALMEDRDGDGIDETQYGVSYKLTLSNFVEATRRDGKLYKEWSGPTSIVIAAGTATDTNENSNKTKIINIEKIDLIRPEFTYKYSESDINKEEKTVKVEFIVADKYFKESTLTSASQLTIEIDRETPIWKGENGNTTGVTRTLTKKTLAAEVTDENGVTYKTNGDIYYDIDGSGTRVKIGEKYVLTLSELEQDAITAGKKYLDYSGIVTIAIPAGIATDYSNNASNSQAITIGIDVDGGNVNSILPSTEYTKPYMPTGYEYLEGNLADGLVIRNRTNGNEFVWVEVPTNIYTASTQALDLDSLSGTALTNAYGTIENELKAYTTTYRNNTEFKDEFYSTDQSGFANANAYNEQKYKMLKSIFTYGGFYVGRYETGIMEGPKTSGDVSIEMPSEVPVIKQNAYPYNFVTNKQAQNLASSNHFAVQGYETSLMFGVQWDLILKYMETKAVEGLSGEEYETKLAEIQSELKTNSTSWGNYKDNNWTIENTNSKYAVDGANWASGLYKGTGNKGNTTTSILLSTGADEDFSKQNIYDMAGNIMEMTLEYTYDTSYPCAIRGGYFVFYGSYNPASFRIANSTDDVFCEIGFRVALYKDPDQDTGSGTPSGGSSSKPSDLYAEGKLQIGDFVNYDAGKWTQEEINAIQVGPTSALVTANGIASLPSTNYQFGGFTADSSRNGNATPYTSSYNFIKDQTGNAVTGWRVFDIADDGTVTLISAGNPEDYRYNTGTNAGYINEYILSGNVNENWSGADTSLYQKRDWSVYENLTQNAVQGSATALSKKRLDTWYSKYTSAGSGADIYAGNNIFQLIYGTDKSLQTVVDNYSFYWLSSATDNSNNIYSVSPYVRGLVSYGGYAFGVRVLVSLDARVLFSENSEGPTTLSGGNLDESQTFNVWDIVDVSDKPNTEGEIVDVVSPHWNLENVNKDETTKTVTADLIVTDKYFDPETETIKPEQIKVFVDGVDTTDSGYANVIIGEATELKEDRDEDGTDETTYGMKYPITIKNWIEPARRDGKKYSNWSGSVQLKIDEGAVIDLNGNISSSEPIDLGDVDFIKPELTYLYSETEIDKDTKTLTVVFYAADRFFDETNSGITLNDFYNPDAHASTDGKVIFRVDGEAINVNVAGNTLTPEEVTENGKRIGTKYTLVVKNLQKYQGTDNDGFSYSGVVSITVPEGKFVDSSEQENNATTITIGIDENGDESQNSGSPLPSTDYTKPYLPNGYSYVEGDLSSGLVIQDGLGNEYVWVEVPRTETVYPNAKLDITEFTDDEYEIIADDLWNYAITCVPSDSLFNLEELQLDEYYSTETTGLTEPEYYVQKKKMLKSVYQYGGFYIGRYETGIEDWDDMRWHWEEGLQDTPQKPIIQKNAAPYTSVTTRQSQLLASSFASNGYSSSLLFAIQRYLTIRYLYDKEAITEAEIENSTGWGNYYYSTYDITNTNAVGVILTSDSAEWLTAPFSKTNIQDIVLLSTGASEDFKKQNIYDFAGNVNEKTLATLGYITDGEYSSAIGDFWLDYDDAYTGVHWMGYSTDDDLWYGTGFRVALYKDEGIGPAQKEEIVDVVDPIWELGDVDLEAGTVKLRAIDKYFNSSTLEAGDIKLILNNVELTADIDITSIPPIDIPGTEYGVETPIVGKEYTLKLPDIIAAEGEYTTFTPIEPIVGGTAKYREGNSGGLKIQIEEKTIVDNSGNENIDFTFDIDMTDITPLEVFKVQVTPNAGANTATIIFNVTDKFYDPSDLITLDVDKNGDGVADPEIKLWIDDERVDSLIQNATLTPKAIKTVINGETVVVGHQYTLVLNNLEQTTRNAKGYKDWSGTIKIEIDEDASKDLNGNTINPEKTTITEFVDFIKPDLKYTHQSTDISTGTKTYTMTFDITDKYYNDATTNKLSIDDLTITMQNGQYERELDANGEWQYKLDGNGKRIPIVYDLKEEPVTIAFNATPKSETFKKTVGGVVETTATSHVIGYTYTLTISGLEQLEIAETMTTLDYSGIITVAVASDKVVDTSNNKNNDATITSGVNIPGGTGNGVAVDVVDPIWEKVSSSANARQHIMETVQDPDNPGQTIEQRTGETKSTATITFKGTDTYFNTNTFDINNVQVLVNGSGVTSGITKTLDSTTNLIEDRIVNGVNTPNVQYGVEYTITIEGFDPNANQVKIRIPKGVLVDETGNDSEATDLIVYNVLKSAATEGNTNSAFLGESVGTTIYPKGVTSVTPIQRQNIEQIVFVNNIKDAVNGVSPRIWDSTEKTWTFKSGVQRVWDVSAQGDDSILAWTFDTTAPYTVYIGSNDEIFANQDSSNLFALIGSDENCLEPETIKGMSLLNTTAVTNMQYMFRGCGANAMTSLTLPESFDTSNVENMEGMFLTCGIESMTELDLGESFDTSNVENMGGMFLYCGSNAMIELDLGNKFDTSKVENMKGMFAACGYTAMTELNLGDKFDTSSVVDMSEMFNNCGYIAMTELDLGDKFDTNKVENMEKMFSNCGRESITKLDLGNKFDTTNVTNMNEMFAGCGASAMTSLDLGPAFTKIASANTDFVKNAGKSGAVTIYAPESIYSSQTGFKLSSTDTTTISLDVIDTSTNPDTYRGIIIPQYKPEWTKESSSLDTTTDPSNPKLTVTVKGSAYNTSKDYASNITSTLAKEDIKVYVNGTEVTSTTNPTIKVNPATSSTNAGGKKELTHTIELTNLEEAARSGGIPYKELSGNIKIKIGGRGKETSTYTANVLYDEYGNQSMMETDEGQTPGTWIDITFEDTATDRNTNNVMFADFIKPEFTYKYGGTSRDAEPNANPEINYGDKSVTMVFDVTDKYFASTDLATDEDIVEQIIVKMSDFTDEEVNNNIEKTLEKVEDVYYPENSTTKVGERYKLIIRQLEQKDANGYSDGFSFSGYMSVSFPSDIVTDLSGNKNAATTIAIGLDENDGNPNTDSDVEGDGVIVDVVDPTWKVQEKTVTTNASGTTSALVKLLATDKYFKQSSLSRSNIQVLVDEDNKTTELDFDLTGPTSVTNGDEYIFSITSLEESYDDFLAQRELYKQNPETGRLYREFSGPVSIVVPAETAEDNYGNKNQLLTVDLGNIDTLRPEVVKVSSSINPTAKTQTIVFDITDKYITSSAITTTDTSKIHVLINGEEASSVTKTITNIQTLTASVGTNPNQTIGYRYTLVLSEFEQATKQEGKQFIEWSGNVSIKIDENTAMDENDLGNAEKTLDGEFNDFIQPKVEKVSATNNDSAKTQTIVFTVTDKYLNTSDALEIGEINVKVDGDSANSIAKPTTTEQQNANRDKIWKELTSSPIKYDVNRDGTVAETEIVGYTYTLVLSNFEQVTKQSGKDFMEWSGTVSIEIDGDAVKDTTGNINGANASTPSVIDGTFADFIQPKIEEVSSTPNASAKTETIVFKTLDKYLNTTDMVTTSEITVYVDGEAVTAIAKPTTVAEQQANKDKVWMELSSSPISNTFKKTVSGTVTNGTYIVGHTYTLVLSNFEQSLRNAKEYKDWSGTVSIEIAENAVKDTYTPTPNGNEETPIVGDFVDFIKPDLKYTHQSTDINTGTKTYTMTFDITDKYYGEATDNKLSIDDLTILMRNGQYERELDANGEWQYKVDGNGNRIPIVYDLKEEPVTIAFNATPKSATFKKTVGGVVETTATSHVIGYTYTVTISGLEQLEIAETMTTLDYSGIITVAVASDKVVDTSNNKNNDATITSGVNIPGGTGNGEAVDVVDPIWEKVSSSANARQHIMQTVQDPDNPGQTIEQRTGETKSTATITFKGTDTYFNTNTFDINNVQVLVNGSGVTSGITKTLDSTTTLKEDRIVNGVNTPNVQYGVEYTITIEGFDPNANQVKIRIPKGVLVDETGNDSEATDLIVYNVLKLAATEGNTNSAFLGESVGTTIYPKGVTSITPIQRQYIEQVVFVNNIKDAVNGVTPRIWDSTEKTWTFKSGVQRVWDVSAQGDDSILAWTFDTTAPYTVYIGSEDEIFANQNSGALFAHIGYGENCTAEETIIHLDKLVTQHVLYMDSMFVNTGYRSMKSLNLGNFDTRNVTSMSDMFYGTGYKAMETFSIGNQFNTSSVNSYMSYMFRDFGHDSLISLDLGDKFDTSHVSNFAGMFSGCGYKSMTSLDLGENFNTSAGREMMMMFSECGFESITDLDLGDLFDTRNVTNMHYMFYDFGRKSLETLDLGDNFDTSNVEVLSYTFTGVGAESTEFKSLDLGDKFNTSNAINMQEMFNGCGKAGMTILDLGPQFTNIPDGEFQTPALTMQLAYYRLFYECGTTGLTIYAPESIYSSQTGFKLNSTDTSTTIQYTRGTIIPQYKPEWTKESSSLDTTTDPSNPKLTVTVKGSAYNTSKDYASNVTSTLAKEDIKVYVNGTEVTSTTNPTIKVNPATSSTNAGGKNELTHTIELTNLEEAARRGGIPYKELSGNIKIKIGGRGKETSTYTANVLYDEYGNQSMMETDEGQTPGTWIDITFEDTATDRNTNNVMFADFVKPEFTYISTETNVDKDNNILTVVFYAVDKYFDATNSSLALSDFYQPGVDASTTGKAIFQIDGEKIDINVAGNSLTKDTEPVKDANNNAIGSKYTLVVKNLQKYQGTDNDGFTYSGIVGISIPANKFKDLSGNGNAATTITVGVDETDGNPNTEIDPNGDIVDVVDPIWELGDVSLDAGTIKLRAIDKYFKECTIDEDAITVIVNGVPSTAVVKDITSITPTEIPGTEYGVETPVVGKEYTLKISNITLGAEAGYVTFNPTEPIVGGTAQYRAENGGDISIKIAEDTIEDNTGNKNIEYTFDIGTIDVTQPEVYDVQKTQNAAENKETFIFNVTDRNYDPSDLVTIDGESEITVWMDDVQLTAIPKPTTTAEQENNKDKVWLEISNIPIKLDIDGVTGKVLGHQYTLVVSNIAETVKQSGKDYLEWSGTLAIKVDEEAAKDLKGNKLNTATTTITDFVDFIKPQVEKVTVANPIDTANKTYTMSFNVIDKYLDTTNMVTLDEILVYVDGETATAIAKPTTTAEQQANKDKIWMEISSTPITATMNKTVNGTITNGSYTIGYTYTLVLSNFEQSAKQSGKSFMEWSGTVSIEIAQTAVNDKNGVTGTAINTLEADAAKRTVAGEHVDFIKPVVEKVTSERGTNTETIYFNIIDKYLDTTDLVTDSEITVYVDGEEANVSKSLTRVTANDGTATVNGTTRTVSHQYKLVLSGFEQSTRNAKDYKDWSGTVTIEIAQNAVKDTSNNTLDSAVAKRTVAGDFVDFIKPELKYTHSASDIDTTNKKYTMKFDITDKYYTSGDLELTTDDLEILMQNGQLDSNGDPIVYDLMELARNGEINITSFTATEKTATFKKTVSGVVETTATSHLIGHTYTLVIEGLEKLEIRDGYKTADYSGVITVKVKQDKVKDSGPSGNGTNPNGNLVTTITSGVNISAGVESGTATEVDVVDPIWEKVSSSANATGKTATIKVRGTDTYLKSDDTDSSTLANDEIEIYINGVKNTSLTPQISSTVTELTEDRIVNGVPATDVQYGVEHTITITGFNTDVNQVKIKILEDAIKDNTGNGNKATEMIVYNVLKSTASEKVGTNAFLGESVATTVYPVGATSVTPINRQDIEQVVFVNSLEDVIDGTLPYIWDATAKEWTVKSGIQRIWDVSAQGDDSILAWTSQTSAPYTVYIGSAWEMFANQDSSYLFSHIGYAESCTKTSTITGLSLLNENYVTDMEGMFMMFGYRRMTALDLEEFNTSNVTNMTMMFTGCGNLAMTSLDLGTQFDTSKVTDMSIMFSDCGQNSMTQFRMGTSTNTIEFNTANVENMSMMFNNFGYKLASLSFTTAFDTRKVTNMSNMFYNCGYTSLTSLTLPTSFNTANVTDMDGMFTGTGYTAMTSLDLGDNFNTSKVTDMGAMFLMCGATSMTSLDLGNLFDTNMVTNMRFMFVECGNMEMTVLDLGPAFTHIPNETFTENGIDYIPYERMFEGCGKEGNLIIYAPESIYANKEAFKTN